MKVKFLGTGGSNGTPEIGCRCDVCTSKDIRDRRKRASVLISIRGKRLLIDCGPDFKEQIINEPFEKLDGVLLTHEHYDHVAGIDDLRAFGQFGDVNVYANQITSRGLLNRIPYCFAQKKYPGVPNINLHILENGSSFWIDDIKIEPIRIMHYKLPILGYRIDNFAYLTDVLTIPDEEYSKLQNLDVLVISALRRETHISHQNVEQALEKIERIAPKQAYLIHMSHSLGLYAVENEKLPHGVALAYDGLELII